MRGQPRSEDCARVHRIKTIIIIIIIITICMLCVLLSLLLVVLFVCCVIISNTDVIITHTKPTESSSYASSLTVIANGEDCGAFCALKMVPVSVK